LYKDGGLVEEAIPILIEEIERRGCPIPSEDEVHQHTIEREKTTARKKTAIWSAVTSGILLFFYFFYQYGGYELIRDELFPNKAAKAYIEKGLEFSQKGNHVKAIEFYQKARACNPSNSDVYLAFGSAYMGLGRFTDAVPFYEKATEIKPDSGYAYGGLAVAYDLLGEYEKAALCAERSLALFEQGLDTENAGKARMLLMKIQEDSENALPK
jgi:tetratricopeptide (TPR) repeat protein